MPSRDEHDLRCEICRFTPLLARYGTDGDGKLYVHVKVFKQRRLFAEMVFTGGTVRLRCRDCLRWHKIRILQPTNVEVTQEELPQAIPVP